MQNELLERFPLDDENLVRQVNEANEALLKGQEPPLPIEDYPCVAEEVKKFWNRIMLIALDTSRTRVKGVLSVNIYKKDDNLDEPKDSDVVSNALEFRASGLYVPEEFSRENVSQLLCDLLAGCVNFEPKAIMTFLMSDQQKALLERYREMSVLPIEQISGFRDVKNFSQTVRLADFKVDPLGVIIKTRRMIEAGEIDCSNTILTVYQPNFKNSDED